MQARSLPRLRSTELGRGQRGQKLERIEVPNRVLKFGGSCLAGTDQIEAAARRVSQVLGAGLSPLVVVSAMTGMTNRILATARRLHPDPPGDELDRLLATGEAQAATLLAIALQQRGLRARSFSGQEAGIVTDNCFGRARIVRVDAARLTASMAAGEIPVVTGFQGATDDGRVTTLGRGGSDITAVALGVAHEADRVSFYRDVDGVHSADPKFLAISYRLDQLDYDSMIDLAEAGAPILHPQALETARAHDMRLEIRGLHSGAGSTTIDAEPAKHGLPVWSIFLSHPMSVLTLEGLPSDVDVLSRLMALLDRTDIRLDGELQPAETRGVCLALQMPDMEGPLLEAQMQDFLREEPGVRVDLERRRRRVTLVGKGVASRRVSKAVEKVALRLGPPMATYWGAHHRAFVVPDREGRTWLASLHQELIHSGLYVAAGVRACADEANASTRRRESPRSPRRPCPCLRAVCPDAPT